MLDDKEADRIAAARREYDSRVSRLMEKHKIHGVSLPQMQGFITDWLIEVADRAKQILNNG